MKQIVTLILFLSFFAIHGQSNSRDVLYLKNGSIIKGTITSMDPTNGVKIETADGSLFVYKMDEILKSEKEEVSAVQETAPPKADSPSQLDLENVFKPYLKRNRPDLIFKGIDRTNGVKRTFFGQKIYEIEYDLLVEASEDIYISFGNPSSEKQTSGEFLIDFSYSKEATNTFTQLLEKGQRALFTGSVGFEETDNGWRHGDFIPQDYKIVSSDYMTAEMKKREAEERARTIARLKKELDWKRPDIGPIEFVTKHLRTDNMPLFGSAYSQYSLSKSSDYTGRNDVLQEIKNMFYPALMASNRHSEIQASDYDSAANKEVAEFVIQNAKFEFVETGYQCELAIKANIQGTYNDPKNIPFSYGLTIPGKSRSYEKKNSKRQALSSALSDLRTNLGNFVHKYKPITIELKKIVTNKRGKVEKVIFKKPEQFITTQRVKFVVLHPNNVTIEAGSSMEYNNTIGECLYKGEIFGDDIVCIVRGSKNKKSFAQYLDRTDGLIGVSQY